VTLTSATAQAMELADLADDAKSYLAASWSDSTSRSYHTGWQQFATWCDAHDLSALPASPETVALYVADLARTAKPATIDARLAAISAAHRTAEVQSPTKSEAVRLVRRGMRRKLGTAQRQVRAVSVTDLRSIIETFGTDSRSARDRALLLVGFAGAFRRSELVALDVADVVESPDGLTITLKRSKTDQEGAGRAVGIPFGSHRDTCPVQAWRDWLDVLNETVGPAFRPISRAGAVAATRLTGQSVAQILKRRAQAVGIDPTSVGGHSLRAGLATAAAAAGVEERIIANTTGHKGTTMLRRYIRSGSLFRDNAAARIGL
jgi:site-specific recombinase XerD